MSTQQQQQQQYHGGINPHAAADLLRQAMLQSRSDDDGHDHIGSTSTTPSGVATPRPDPADKRLPGIIHSYFGQVRARSSTSTRPRDLSPLAAPESHMGTPSHSAKSFHEGASCALPTAPSSPSPESGKADGPPTPPLLPLEAPQQGDFPDHATVAPYPTPPISSPSSIHKEGLHVSDAGGSSREDDGSSTSRPSLGRHASGNDVIPLRTRRHTGGLNPLFNIMTSSSVHAAHISNPTSPSSSAVPSLPSKDLHTASAHSSLISYLGQAKLTPGVAAPPRIKNTPPLTPRALSSDGSDGATKALPTSNPSATDGTRSEKPGTNGFKTQPKASPSPPVGPPKGKLSVKISGARGLRPSYDPYVVCVFEWNESIASEKQADSGMERDEPQARDEVLGGLPIKRSGSDMGRSMAIPMKSRQSSTTSLSDQKKFRTGRQVTDPSWDHEAIFDVLGGHSDIDLYVYDRADQEAFLGHVKISPNVTDEGSKLEGWYKLEARDPEADHVSGEIHFECSYQKTDKKHYGPEDFQILKLIGKGTFGQVYLVRKKDTQRVYAMKVLSKKVIVQKKEIAHTLGERNILVRTAMADSPFIVGLKFSFQTATDLYLVTGYMSGGELFWHLQKAGRFNETRAKFYIAELILALQHLHSYDIVYRDLKPENILLDANGHIALCDFGLSKANLTKDDTTNTFCGTTEYLAPEVLLDEQGYTTMVDFWSLGVLVFEMCCGWSPFYADDTQQMYKNIAFGKVRFPRDALSTEGRNFVKGLLNRNPKHRLGAINDAEDLKAHPFFADMDWDALMNKMVVPPFKPKLKSVLDTSNFDPEFTNALQNSSSLNARAAALASGHMPASTPLSPGVQANFKGFTFVDESTMDEQFRGNDLEKMEEDNEEDWEQPSDPKGGRENRMSGIIKTSDGEEGIFNNSHFDI